MLRFGRFIFLLVLGLLAFTLPVLANSFTPDVPPDAPPNPVDVSPAQTTATQVRLGLTGRPA